MTTSGTTTFDLQIEDIIDEAYERCGSSTTSGYSLKSARRSLNILFSEWGNRGVHLWKVELKNQLMVSGTSTYATPQDCSDVLEAYISSSLVNTTNTQDISLSKIDRSAYAALPNKGQTGQPSQYYVNRQINPEISLYLVPDCTLYTYLKYYYIQRIQDAGAYTNTADLPYRFLPCMVSGLAFYLSQKVNPKMSEQLRMYYEDDLQRALTEDGQRTSVFISPQTYYGDGVL
jgi:hypothetical protein